MPCRTTWWRSQNFESFASRCDLTTSLRPGKQCAKIMLRWNCEKQLVCVTILRDIGDVRVSLTTDMWTFSATKGYMVVTMHWINASWEIKSVMLGFTRVEYPHSGPRLAQHLLDTVRAMHGSLLRSLWAITTDNAKNNGTMIDEINETLQYEITSFELLTMPSSASEMRPALGLASRLEPKVFQVRCLAHVLQLGVKAGLNKCPIMDDSVSAVRDILKKISESPSLLEALQNVCASVDVKFVAPELDCVTRWNSTLTMLSSARSLQKAIEELQRRIRERHEGYKDLSIAPTDRLAQPIRDVTWSYLAELTAFLRPIKGATTMMSGKNYPTFGMTLVVFHLVSKHAAKVVDNSASWYTKDFARAFKEKLHKYIPSVKTREAKIAAALDPWAKAHLAKIDGDIEQVKRYVIDEYDSEYRSAYERNLTSSPATERGRLENEKAADEEALYELMDEHLDEEATESIANESFSSELNRWMDHEDKSMTLKTSSRDVCRWIRSEATVYPRIQRMARDYLPTMATSVPSEEAFSASGTTLSSRRAKLADDAVTAILELQAFLAFNVSWVDAHAEAPDT